jgi:glutamate synthase (NADPH/NADH) small chain
LKFPRQLPARRPVPVRLRDWKEVYEAFPVEDARNQGARCMDCGIPFCHEGCPLGNLIPEWNDLVYRDDWSEAIERLHATNNFPEFTGRLCPAPCEGSCVLGINDDPVTIERIEYEIAERAWADGWVEPHPGTTATGKRVAVVGSGPAGLAAAQQLRRAGHQVVVFERAEKPGGLLRFGIPEFKMEKAVLDRRLDQLEAEGIEFRCGVSVGRTDTEVASAVASDATVVDPQALVDEFDAVVLAGGATLPRDLAVPGRDLAGIHRAMDFLKPSNLVQEGLLAEPPVSAHGKHVVIIGGGDTGADCLGTVHRQGALSVHQLEIMPEPPGNRVADNPWPTWPLVLRTSSALEEGGERLFSVTTAEFLDDGTGHVRALRGSEVELTTGDDGRPGFHPVEGSEFELPCELVLLAMGFLGTERSGVVADLGLEVDGRGSVVADRSWSTNVESVFVCGDMTRGQSLIVWAIAEGRSAAASVDRFLMGSTSLPAPIVPGQLALR